MDSTESTLLGTCIREQCLGPHHLGVVDGARLLGASHQLCNVVTDKAGISPEMTIRLAKAFGGGDEEWLRLRLAYDLAQTRRRAHTTNVAPITRFPPARKKLQQSFF
jgi:addiction module HigA family antidote